jgi:hypothetical protein
MLKQLRKKNKQIKFMDLDIEFAITLPTCFYVEHSNPYASINTRSHEQSSFFKKTTITKNEKPSIDARLPRSRCRAVSLLRVRFCALL